MPNRRASMLTTLAWLHFEKWNKNITVKVQWYSTYWQEKRLNNISTATSIHPYGLCWQFLGTGVIRKHIIQYRLERRWQRIMLQATASCVNQRQMLTFFSCLMFTQHATNERKWAKMGRQKAYFYCYCLWVVTENISMVFWVSSSDNWTLNYFLIKFYKLILQT
jgi:hypothetical protein